jgi:hypothetical protein
VSALAAAFTRLSNRGPLKRIVCLNHEAKIKHLEELAATQNDNRALTVFWTIDPNPYELFIVDERIAFVGLTFPGIEQQHVDDWWIEIQNEEAVKQLVMYYDHVLCPKNTAACIKAVNERFAPSWQEIIGSLPNAGLKCAQP